MASYVLGVDGGGTKTDYLLFDTEGNLKAHLRGVGMNHERMAGGFTELETRLNEALLPFLAENSLAPQDLAGSVFGMAGVDVPSQKAIMEEIFARMGFRTIRVMNDAFIGIKAGSRKGYGICAVNGTGNTIAGIDRSGRWLQIAGMGYISGEDGGAIKLAEYVLRAVYEEIFCLGVPTAMTPRVMELLDISSPDYFMEAIYAKYKTGIITERNMLDILFTTASRNDEAATRILRHVGCQIAKCIAGCERRLDFDEELDVVLVGSVTLKANCPILIETLMSETLRLTKKSVHFIPLTTPVAVGAVLWAIELTLGHPAELETIDKIILSVESLGI
jgi:N-acetylglucosamine kinase-like BadF-type ATPase